MPYFWARCVQWVPWEHGVQVCGSWEPVLFPASFSHYTMLCKRHKICGGAAGRQHVAYAPTISASAGNWACILVKVSLIVCMEEVWNAQRMLLHPVCFNCCSQGLHWLVLDGGIQWQYSQKTSTLVKLPKLVAGGCATRPCREFAMMNGWTVLVSVE